MASVALQKTASSEAALVSIFFTFTVHLKYATRDQLLWSLTGAWHTIKLTLVIGNIAVQW